MSTADYPAAVRASRIRASYVAAREWAATLPPSPLLLAMRVAAGMVFFNSGQLKVNSFEFAIRLFREEYRLPIIDPVLAAQLATFVEVTVPLFLFAGFATRLATLPLLGMTAVIQVLVFPGAWPAHLMWASLLVFVLVRGPGVFSIDHVIEHAIRGNEPMRRAWSYALVAGSLSLTLGLAVAAFPQIVPAGRDVATAIQWMLLGVALVTFAWAWMSGARDEPHGTM